MSKEFVLESFKLWGEMKKQPFKTQVVEVDFNGFHKKQIELLGLAINPHAVGCAPTNMLANQKQEGNNPMYNTINSTTPIEAQQKNYLLDRARNVYYGLEQKLFDQFHINDDVKPKTLKELQDRIAKGQFVIRDRDGDYVSAEDWDDEEDDFAYGNLSGSIRWRDPAKKADYKGREVALKDLEKAKTALNDVIMIGEADEALKALQAFENWVPSNLPS